MVVVCCSGKAGTVRKCDLFSFTLFALKGRKEGTPATDSGPSSLHVAYPLAMPPHLLSPLLLCSSWVGGDVSGQWSCRSRTPDTDGPVPATDLIGAHSLTRDPERPTRGCDEPRLVLGMGAATTTLWRGLCGAGRDAAGRPMQALPGST